MKALLMVAAGGALGSALRFAIQRTLNQSFPYGTLAVNLAGCFIVGILWATILERSEAKELQFLLVGGFCGGFTTFSAFTLEGMQLITNGRYLMAVTYLGLSVAGGLLATFTGYKLFS